MNNILHRWGRMLDIQISNNMLILISLIIHILFLAVSFDIHFTSPVVQNVSSHSWKKTGEAKRLVLIIADGLRFDTFWKANTLHLQ